MTFAPTTNGGRVRIAEIVYTERPGTMPGDTEAWSIVATVKGRRDNTYIGPFDSRDAATAWLDEHLPTT